MKRKQRTYAGPRVKLPHDRDENTHAPQPPQPVIEQAASDVEAGLVDTDNYTRANAVAKRRPRRLG